MNPYKTMQIPFLIQSFRANQGLHCNLHLLSKAERVLCSNQQEKLIDPSYLLLHQNGWSQIQFSYHLATSLWPKQCYVVLSEQALGVINFFYWKADICSK